MTASCRPARRLFEGQYLDLSIFWFGFFVFAPLRSWEHDAAHAGEHSRWE